MSHKLLTWYIGNGVYRRMYSLLCITSCQTTRKNLRNLLHSREGIWQNLHMYFAPNTKEALRNVSRLPVDMLIADTSAKGVLEKEWIDWLRQRYDLVQGEIAITLFLRHENRDKQTEFFVRENRAFISQVIILQPNETPETDALFGYHLENAIQQTELRRRHFLLTQENQNLLVQRANRLPKQLEFDFSFDLVHHMPLPSFLLYQSETGKTYREKLLLAAGSDATVLLLADRGSETEAAAIFLHQHNPRRKPKPFIKLDLKTINIRLQEQALLGGKMASGQKVAGALDNAGSGTLFIENPELMAWELQGKLVDILNQREYQRLGEKKKNPLNCQLILAAPRDLWLKAEKNHFRQDLFYKLQNMPVPVPSLADVREDLPAILDAYSRWYSGRFHKEVALSEELKEFLCKRTYPGNFQELYSLLYKIHSYADVPLATPAMLSRISELKEQQFADKPLRREIQQFLREKQQTPPEKPAPLFQGTLEELERHYITQVLKKHGQNMSTAARSLGITRKTLYDKIKKFGIEKDSRKKKTG